MMRSLLRKLSRSVSAPRRPQRAPRANLSVERLEDRWLPSITLAGAAMTITGDGLADTIMIRDDGQGNITASLQSAAGTTTQTASGITSIKVNGGAGQDNVTFRLTGALTTTMGLTFNLQNSVADTLNVDACAGINGGNLNIVANAGSGNSQFTSMFGDMMNKAALTMMNCLGSGQTTESISFGKIDNSTVNTLAGTDDGGAISVTQNFKGLISNGSTVDAHLALGKGQASGALTFGCINDATVSTDTDASGGNDTITESFGALSAAKVDAEGCLGSGNVTFKGGLTGNVTNGSSVSAKLNGQGVDNIGFDAGTGKIDSTSSVGVTLNNSQGNGSDNVAFHYDGVLQGQLSVSALGCSQQGITNDTVTVSITDEFGSTGSISAKVHGGAGHDNLALNVNNNAQKLASIDATIFAMHNDTLAYTPNVKVVYVG